MEDKNSLRNRILNERNTLSKDEIEVLSSRILDRLLSLEAVMTASEVFTYVSFGSEVDTFGLILTSLLSSKKVYCPKILERGIMEFYRITSLEQLVPGKYGILEPMGEELGYFRGSHQVMILPGVVFDPSLNRIGYGGGYYDRYLTTYDQGDTIKIALAYELQMVDLLPVEGFDKKMNLVVTESTIYDSNSKK